MNTPEQSLGFLLADVSRLMRRKFQQRLADSCLTLAQARALVYVSRNEGVHQVELAELLEVQPITLARLLDQLSDAGLVERRADPDDRRAFRIYLTPDAAPHLKKINRVGAAIKKEVLHGMSDKQAETFISTLNHLRNTLITSE